jgi:UDP-N-acetylmuramyl pentapeptide phosphotransferase/UDP-N-acetylglucosamine-1-phosphate transferase
LRSVFFDFAHGAVLFSALIIQLLILNRASDIAVALGVVDHPDEVRKRHQRATPLVGGLAIMTTLLLWTAVSLIGGDSADASLKLASSFPDSAPHSLATPTINHRHRRQAAFSFFSC